MGIRRAIKRAFNKFKRKLQGKKGKLRLVIVMGGIISVVLIAALITGVFYKPLSDHYVPPREIAEWDLPTPTPAVVDVTNPTTSPNTPVAVDSPEPTPSEEQEPGNEPTPQTPTPETPKTTSEPEDIPDKVSENDDKNIDANLEDAEVIDDTWLDNKIKEHESELDPVDLEDFKAIIAKLDQALIKELAAGGFTDEEAAQLIKHMKQNLTDEEYARSKELFKRYNYLLEDV